MKTTTPQPDTATETAGKLTVAIMHPQVWQMINGRKHSSLTREIRLVSEAGGTIAILSHHGHHHAERLARCWNEHTSNRELLLATQRTAIECAEERDRLRASVAELLAALEGQIRSRLGGRYSIQRHDGWKIWADQYRDDPKVDRDLLNAVDTVLKVGAMP